MTNEIAQAIQTGLEAAGIGSPYYQAGQFAAGVAVGVVGSVLSWIGKQIWNRRKKK